MHVDDAFELYEKLKSLNLLKESPPFWWPAYGTFEVVIGAILTQNTSWSNVEKSLQNLKNNNLLTIEAINTCNLDLLMQCIYPSGFYKNKSKFIKLLTHNIFKDFGDFETFSFEVNREWLLAQKGIGPESADSILCYACKRAEMVVDKYTQRLLNSLGYEFESYNEIKSWCEDLYSQGGVMHAYLDEDDLPEVYANFHGMIVEYMKLHSSRKVVEIIF